MKIAVISDTHGLLRPAVASGIEECEHVIHAGDVGDRQTLARLRRLKPVTVVRGNVDHGAWAGDLPRTAIAELGGKTFFVVHDFHELDLDPRTAGIVVVVSGHTHKPAAGRKSGVLYLNPGSAGPKRSGEAVSYAIVEIEGAKLLLDFRTVDPAST
jgi:hypothetical protein